MITTIHFTTCGDIHHDLTNLDKLVTFIKNAKSQGYVDFAAFLGDYATDATTINDEQDVKNRFDSLELKYYVAAGNHDVTSLSLAYTNCTDNTPTHTASCIFNTVFGTFPDQYPPTTNFVRNGITFQILIPGICWNGTTSVFNWKYNFSNSNISTTNPTLVFNHGSFYCCDGSNPPCSTTVCTCGNWTTYDNVFSNRMLTNLNNLKVIAAYSGHLHAYSENRKTSSYVTNGKLFVSHDTINTVTGTTSSRCSADATRFIGYTKVTYDSTTGISTVDYQKMAFRDANGNVLPFIYPFDCPQSICNFTITQ